MPSVLLANPPPGQNLQDASVQGIVNVLRPLLSLLGLTTGTASGTLVLKQAAIPNTTQQGAIWERISNDTNGQPLGRYTYYNGRWVRVPVDQLGTLKYFRTDPTSFFNMDTGLGLFDSGTPGLGGDWYGWKMHLGTVNANTVYNDRFLISGSSFDTASGHYFTKASDGTLTWKGGRAGADLATNVIPSLPIVGREYDTNGTDSTPRVVVSTKTSGNDVTSGDGSGYVNASQTNLNSYPPYITAGLVEYIGMVYVDPTVPLATT